MFAHAVFKLDAAGYIARKVGDFLREIGRDVFPACRYVQFIRKGNDLGRSGVPYANVKCVVVKKQTGSRRVIPGFSRVHAVRIDVGSVHYKTVPEKIIRR